MIGNGNRQETLDDTRPIESAQFSFVKGPIRGEGTRHPSRKTSAFRFFDRRAEPTRLVRSPM